MSETAVAAPSLPASSFQEIQRPGQWWVWVMIGVSVTALAWICFACQIVAGMPFGPSPAPDWLVLGFWLVFGVANPLLFWTCRLTTEVLPDRLDITFFPFFRRQIAYRDIVSCQAISYQPLVQFGGWGIRFNMDGSWAYSISGFEAVQIVFHNGKRLLIGSQFAVELAQAIESNRGLLNGPNGC